MVLCLQPAVITFLVKSFGRFKIDVINMLNKYKEERING